MTIIYDNTKWAQTFLRRGIMTPLGTHAITVYSGSQPSAATIAAGFSSYNSGNSNFLAHYQSAVWTQSGSVLNLTPPAAVNASNTGTAAWAILWATNPALASMGSTIPTANFIVVPVGATGGNGVIEFASLSFTASASKAISAGLLAVSL